MAGGQTKAQAQAWPKRRRRQRRGYQASKAKGSVFWTCVILEALTAFASRERRPSEPRAAAEPTASRAACLGGILVDNDCGYPSPKNLQKK
jgi:hypothetical protein